MAEPNQPSSGIEAPTVRPRRCGSGRKTLRLPVRRQVRRSAWRSSFVPFVLVSPISSCVVDVLDQQAVLAGRTVVELVGEQQSFCREVVRPEARTRFSFLLKE
jgi:hypothetical protein